MENNQGKKVKVKDMNKHQIRKYKSGKERERWTHFVNAADPLEIKLWLQLVQNISKVDF